MNSLYDEHRPRGLGRTVIQKAWGSLRMIGGMLDGTYPRFVMGNDIGDELPVFYFHEAYPASFERQLEYLKTNGYRTWISEDLSGRHSLTGKEVMLTFDDGLSDIYNSVWPLLKQFDFQIVAFISPFWIGTEGILNWEQVEEMHDSGHVDFQSHSHSHEVIPVSPEVVDFFRSVHTQMSRWDLPLSNRSDSRIWPDLGAPIYQYDSGLCDKKKFIPDADLESECIRFIENHGGSDFFQRWNWRDRLMKIVRSRRINPRYETDRDQESRIRFQLEESKRQIESRLRDKKVTAFAYPHHVQGKITGRLLAETGYRFVLGGLEKNEMIADFQRKFRYIRRINGDFIRRLPGQERASLRDIFISKAGRS